MTAEIRQVDRSRRAVFVFAAAPMDGPGADASFYDALERACGDGPCRVAPGVRLIEFGCFDQLKRQALDLPDAAMPDGVWIGAKILDATLWGAIVDGRVTSFDLNWSADTGIQFEADLQTTFKEEHMNTIDGEGVFHLAKSDPHFGLIAKCVTAFETGNLGSLTRRDFEAALDGIAKSYAKESGVTYEAAYSAILDTQIGGQLYWGTTMAALAAMPQANVAKCPCRLETVRKLETSLDDLARERSARTGENFYAAYSKVLDSDEGRKIYSTMQDRRIEELQRNLPPD